MRDWARLRSFAGFEYRRIKQEKIGRYLVSTVWIGLDHGIGSERPLIFETMVFEGEGNQELACERYSTERDALEGHERIAEEVRLTNDAMGEGDAVQRPGEEKTANEGVAQGEDQ